MSDLFSDRVRLALDTCPAATTAWRDLEQAGGRVYAVGGAVRDAMLDRTPSDVDLLVGGLEPEAVHSVLAAAGRVDLVGESFGVFVLSRDGDRVEVSLPRRDASSGRGHRDFHVQVDPHMPVEEDLRRRDFTVNAMALDPFSGKLLDPSGGCRDAVTGTLRVLTDRSFIDDPLRVMRGLVLNARFGLLPDQTTARLMSAYAPDLYYLPRERVQAELDKILAAEDPAGAVSLAHDRLVLQHVLPDVDACFGYDQNNRHHDRELGEHLLEVLRAVSILSEDRDLRLAALLHDVAKRLTEEYVAATSSPFPVVVWRDDEGWSHYYENHDLPEPRGADHEVVGAEMTRVLMRDLRYPQDRVNRVSALVLHHMFAPFTHRSGARRFLQRAGGHVDDLLDLREADSAGKPAKHVNARLRELVAAERAAGSAHDVSMLAVRGTDLIEAGVPEGPEIGATLRRMLEAVVSDPDLNDKDRLLEMVR